MRDRDPREHREAERARLAARGQAAREGQADDAGRHEEEAELLHARQRLAREAPREQRDEQRREAARDRVDEAEVAQRVGPQQEHVVEDVDRHGGEQPGPGLRRGHLGERHGGEPDERAHQHDDAEGQQPVAVRLDDRVPARVDQRGDEDQPDDRGIELHLQSSWGGGIASAGITAPRWPMTAPARRDPARAAASGPRPRMRAAR